MPHQPRYGRPLMVLLLGFSLLLLTRAASADHATIRPLSDFLSAQSRIDIQWTDPSTNRVAVVDYAGKEEEYIETASGGSIDPGTQISGNIIERPLGDGRVEVTVVVRATKALTWVTSGGSLLFGHTTDQVLAGQDPALGFSHVRIVFVNPSSGLPMPALGHLIFTPDPGQVLLSLSLVECSAQGTFRAAFGVPEGTPGIAHIIQRAKLPTHGACPPSSGSAVDFFRVERIELRVIGHKS